MITRSMLRWATAVVLALGALGVIGLALNGMPAAQAAGTTYIYPGLFPCNTTLQACINGVAAGDVIQIKAGVYTESVSLNKGTSLIGQGWAKTELRAAARQRVLTIDDSTNPITESTIISGLMLSNGQAPGAVCPAGCGGGILITGTARPVLSNLWLTGNQAAYQGGGLYAESDAQISESVFQNNGSGSYGGGAYVNGTAHLQGGRFEGNHVDNQSVAFGGGLYALSGSVHGTHFISNSAVAAGCSCFGGGVYLFGNGLDTLEGVRFSNNHSVYGGGLYEANSVTLTNVVLDGNIAEYSGGGVYANSISLVGTHFTGNSAHTGNGGGAYVFGATQLQAVRFESNTSYSVGAGLYAGSLAGQDAWFVGNQTLFGDGAGAYVAYVGARRPSLGLGMTDLRNSFFVQNVSGGSGGGLAGNGSVTLTNVIMVGNAASLNGGGVYGSNDVNIIGGAYENNIGVTIGVTSTVYSGGAIYSGGPLFISSAVIHANQSQGLGGGGGAYANTTALVTGADFQDNTAGFWPGGGLYANTVADVFSTVFISNSAGGGGGVHSGGALNLTDVTMRGNHVANDGVSTGGAVESTADVTVSGGLYDGNSAELAGGAFYVSGALQVSRTQLSNNTVTVGNGGGLYAIGPLTVTRSLFIGNNAVDGGALYQTTSGDARVVNSLFASNQMSPTLPGAALSFNMLGSAEVAHDTIVDNNSNPGIAISAAGGASLAVTNTIIGWYQIGINASGGIASENYNLYFANLFPQVGTVITGLNSLYGLIPNFSNPLLNDYHLHVGSPGTGRGVLLPDVPDDIDGQIRPLGSAQPDIGYDEVGATIQQMINNARPGDTVYVPAGAYTESLTLDRAANLVGAGANTSGLTVIHAVAGSRVLTVTGLIDRSTRIADLTLMGGNITGLCPTFCGGGVLVTRGANPTFDNVAVEFNRAGLGGGLYLDGGGALLLNSQVISNVAAQSGGGVYFTPILTTSLLEQHGGIIANNQAVDGAGVFVKGGLYQLYNTNIVNNAAQRWGGGLLAADPGARAELYDSNVISNSTSLTLPAKGGGIFIDQGQVSLQNTAMVNNTSVQGGGVFVTSSVSTGRLDVNGGLFMSNGATQSGGAVYALSGYGITGTRFFLNSAGLEAAALNHAGGEGRIVNTIVAANVPVSSSAAIMNFAGGAKAQLLHDTFGNNGTPHGYAVTINSAAQVSVADTIFATYTQAIRNAGGVAQADYNLFFGNTNDYFGTVLSGTHSIYGRDPMFMDPANLNFHLRGLSPAVNRGKDVGVRHDIDLDARPLGGGFDIGADEASVAGTDADPLLGGSFTYTTAQNSTINMVLPPGAVTQTTPLYCSLLDNATVPPPHSLMFAGVAFELDAQPDPNGDPGSISFNTPVTLSVSYTDQQLVTAGITDEQQLRLYRFETIVNQWEPIGFRNGETQTLDVANNLITATLLGFSRFGTMAPTSNSEVYLPLILLNFKQ